MRSVRPSSEPPGEVGYHGAAARISVAFIETNLHARVLLQRQRRLGAEDVDQSRDDIQVPGDAVARLPVDRGVVTDREAMAKAVVDCAGIGVCTSDYGQLRCEKVRRPIYPLDLPNR